MTESLSAPARTALFVPGNRPDRFGKATASGADLVILDLEDAVSASEKYSARESVFNSLSTGNVDAAVRINVLATEGEADLAMLARLDLRGSKSLRAVLLPKAESVGDLSNIANKLPGFPIIPIIETASGLAACNAIAQYPRVERLAFGALDFGVDVGAKSSTMLDFARCQIVVSSRAAGLSAPLDSPSTEIHALEVVRAEAQNARHLGFGGQLCIHPLQVPVVAVAFQPTDDEIAWARRVMGAEGIDGVTQVDGAMVDRPVLLRANAILEQLSE